MEIKTFAKENLFQNGILKIGQNRAFYRNCKLKERIFLDFFQLKTFCSVHQHLYNTCEIYIGRV